MHYFEKNNLKMNGLYIVYNAGSMYEEEGKSGTMHLMEHLICKSFDDMQDEFTKRCIEFNAYTDEEVVVVHLRGINTQLDSDLKVRVVSRLTNGKFANEDDFNKEKQIVLQEYYNYFNDITFGCVANYLRKKFNNFSVIGCAEDINNYTYTDAVDIFNKYFKTPSCVIEVGKEKSDFSFVEYNNISLCKKRIKYGNYYNSEEIVPESETNSVVLATPKTPISKKDYPIFWILNTILCDGLNSPLYQELREKRGLIYGIMPSNLTCVNDTIFMYSAMTTKENASEVAEIIRDILTNLDDYVTEDRFNDVINSCLIQIDINDIFRYKKPKSLTKNLPSTFKNKKQFENVTIQDVINVGKKYFNNIEIVYN